jgi:hypothetical protein
VREERLFVGLIVADIHSPWAVWVDCDADLGRTLLAAKTSLRLAEGRNHFRLIDLEASFQVPERMPYGLFVPQFGERSSGCLPELTTGLASRSAIECRTRGGVRHHNGNKWRYGGVCFRAELTWESVCMSILENFDVDPETKPVLRIALERTRMSLGLTDGLADGIIANQIIQFAKAGERNPDLLCERALKKLREHLFGD